MPTNSQTVDTFAGKVLAAAKVACNFLTFPGKTADAAMGYLLGLMKADTLETQQVEKLSALVDKYEKVAPHDLCSLQVSKVALGTEVTFVIPKGKSGRDILCLIERAHPRPPLKGVVCPGGILSKDEGLDIKVTEDTKFTFIVCEKSGNRYRKQQESYLKENNLDPVSRYVLTLGAALFRDREGFPENQSDLGSRNDKGDLFQGNMVRACTYCIHSWDNGMSGSDFDDSNYAFERLVMAGTPRTNIKS